MKFSLRLNTWQNRIVLSLTNGAAKESLLAVVAFVLCNLLIFSRRPLRPQDAV